MKEFNFIINGGGCSGLSLAYEMEKKGILDKKNMNKVYFKNFTIKCFCPYFPNG